MPRSLPWRMPWVGSWCSQKTRSSSLVGDAGRVVDHENDLRVAGPSAADLLVGGVRGEAAGVADGRRDHARQLPERPSRRPRSSPGRRRRSRAPSGQGGVSGVPVDVVAARGPASASGGPAGRPPGWAWPSGVGRKSRNMGRSDGSRMYPRDTPMTRALGRADGAHGAAPCARRAGPQSKSKIPRPGRELEHEPAPLADLAGRACGW